MTLLKELLKMTEATEQKDFARITMKQVFDKMGGKEKILADFKGKTSEQVANAMEKVCQKLQNEANAYETEAPELHHFMDWADGHFES